MWKIETFFFRKKSDHDAVYFRENNSDAEKNEKHKNDDLKIKQFWC